MHSEQEACRGKIFLCVRMASLHRFVLFRSQCQEQTLWKERSKVKWWENIGKYLKTGKNREGGRERQMAGREAGVVVEFCVLSCRSPFPLSLLSLSLVVFTLLLSFHLSLALNHFSIFIISDTIWLFFLCVKYFDTIVVRLYYWFVICYLKCFVNFDLSLLNFLWARIVYSFLYTFYI